MADTQHFCLRWNNYQSSITSAFENLRDDEDFVDVTLACDGRSLKAHRVVLSACSPYFRELLKSTPCKHPVIVLQDVAFADLHALVEFIYHGEVNVHQRNLSSFLKTAEVLRVSGLTQKAEEKEEDLSQAQNCGRSNQHGYADRLVDDGLFASPPSPSPQGPGAGQALRRGPPAGHRERRNSGDFPDPADQLPPSKRVRPGDGPENHACGPASPFPPRPDDGERDSSRSPPAADGVKSEPMDLLGDGEDSADSVRDDADGVQALQAPSPYLSAASESKLFASATPSGSFNFSMAALAADASNMSNLNTQPLPPNPDGTPGTSSQAPREGGHYRLQTPSALPCRERGGPQPPYCRACDKSFSRAWSLHRHLEDVHRAPGGRVFACELCRRAYSSRSSLVSHRSQAHAPSRQRSGQGSAV
ncbi:broad-complex core protein isoforms 1/2/3/4/5-like isoform X3 [Bacillus rossius redtenbacheri]|uniref:broad-complex core protein isoforms 1/2/3/4/5-like isoform X3 n=1 Tax=Bacillus rossius redtenbacheri TaxID=93214 RepID=UPI002FDD928A